MRALGQKLLRIVDLLGLNRQQLRAALIRVGAQADARGQRAWNVITLFRYKIPILFRILERLVKEKVGYGNVPNRSRLRT